MREDDGVIGPTSGPCYAIGSAPGGGSVFPSICDLVRKIGMNGSADGADDRTGPPTSAAARLCFTSAGGATVRPLVGIAPGAALGHASVGRRSVLRSSRPCWSMGVASSSSAGVKTAMRRATSKASIDGNGLLSRMESYACSVVVSND